MNPAFRRRPKVSVVVCTYADERTALVEKCVASVQSQSHRADEIILVVDHNPWLAGEMTRRLPEVLLIENLGRQGCAASRNTGASASTGDIIVFLDDDAVADPDWLSELIAPMQDPFVLGTTGRVIPEWPKGRPTWFPPEFDWVVGCSYAGLPPDMTDVRNLWGTSMAVRRETFLQMAGFDESMGRLERIPLGCEDTEFSLRLRASNPEAKLLYVPTSGARHQIEPVRTQYGYFVRRCFAEGLSKAVVAAQFGRSIGLSTENAYVKRALSAAVRREVRRSVAEDHASFLRAITIVIGLATTVAGYVRGRAQLAARTRRSGGVGRVVPWTIRTLEPGDRSPTKKKSPESDGSSRSEPISSTA